jgi:UDP-glucose:(heptosyl)LPS alpha-1,3-glucosyltransferase
MSKKPMPQIPHLNSPIVILKSQLSRIGGVEKYTWQIIKALRKQDIPVTLLTTGDPIPPFSDPELKIISFSINSPLSALNVYQFDAACSRYLKNNPSPIVLGLDRNRFQTHLRAGNGSHAAFLKRRAQEEGRFKTFSFQINPLHRLLLKLERQSFEHSDLQILFTNSEMVRTEILSLYKTPPEKIQVVHNGVEWTEMSSHFNEWFSNRSTIAHTLDLDLSRYQFLFIGHNYQRKGLDPLLYGLSSLPHRDFQLSVVGKEKNLPFFQHLVHQLKLESCVRFFGEQQEIHRFYQVADCLCIPSFYDPFANVTVEALAMGLFVVSSKNNGGHEVLTPTTGTIIPALSNPSAIASALTIALQHPKTPQSAQEIRNATRYLDFPNQLNQMIQKIVKT